MRISDWSSDVCSSDLPMTSTSGGNYPVEEVAQAWLIKMRGEDADALRGEFEAWLLASADHGEAYRRAERRMAALAVLKTRSEERRVGKGCVKTCRAGG